MSKEKELITLVSDQLKYLYDEVVGKKSFPHNTHILILSGKEHTGKMEGGQFLTYNVSKNRLERVCMYDISQTQNPHGRVRNVYVTIISFKPFKASLENGVDEAFLAEFIPEFLDTIGNRCALNLMTDMSDVESLFTQPIPKNELSDEYVDHGELVNTILGYVDEPDTLLFYKLDDIDGNVIESIAIEGNKEYYPNHKSYFFLKEKPKKFKPRKRVYPK